MPTIAVFYGITVRLYFGDHPPPHVHAIYGDAEAVVAIDPPRITAGALPRRAAAMVLEWVGLRRGELLAAWDAAQQGLRLGRIEPLE
jgi:Domain of unknown function (DUF4160)